MEQGLSAAARRARVGQSRHLYLLGTPPLRRFLDFVRLRAPPEPDLRLRTPIAEWRRAALRVEQLARDESGCVDQAVVESLPVTIAELAQRALEEPWTARSLASLPSRWALVDLDQLIVHQRSIDLNYIERLAAVFPRSPTDEQLFLLAAGRLGLPAAVRAMRASDSVFTFSSPSTDLRFLDMMLVDPQAVPAQPASGRAAGAVVAFVGFGVNCLTALRMRGRLILTNGTNRAKLLYERGIRRAPCLVRELSGSDDVDLAGPADLSPLLELYLQARRPPRLKDFTDPILSKVVCCCSAEQVVHVQLSAQRSRVAIGMPQDASTVAPTE